jgi:hypothetical protein
MQKLIRSLTVVCSIGALLTLPVLMSGKGKKEVEVSVKEVTNTVNNSAEMAIEAEASSLYDALAINGDINMKTLVYALKGYRQLQASGKLKKDNILSIVDMSQSSKNKRLYIIDVESKKLLYNTYVAHGRNSGSEYATSFSNEVDSHKSSLGFYVTNNTYNGSHGLSLRIEGVEKGFNDRALERAVVIHGADYIGDQFLRNRPFSGRSWGCPAVPAAENAKVINMIKDGSCLFIYHPTEKYLQNSQILNATSDLQFQG